MEQDEEEEDLELLIDATRCTIQQLVKVIFNLTLTYNFFFSLN